LGGNSKTTIIANTCPSVLHAFETESTLRFAHNAKKIRNKAVINEMASVNPQLQADVVAKYENEIASLKATCDKQERLLLVSSLHELTTVFVFVFLRFFTSLNIFLL